MPQCYVDTCGNYYEKTRGGSKIIYHMLPGDPILMAKWIRACGKKEQKRPSYARVCSDHFSEKCYQRDLQHELLGLPLRRKLKPGAVPDRNLPKQQKPKIESKSRENTTKTSLDISIDKQNLPTVLTKSKSKEKTIIVNSLTSNKNMLTTTSWSRNDLKKKLPELCKSKKNPVIENPLKIKEFTHNDQAESKKKSTRIYDFKTPRAKALKLKEECNRKNQVDTAAVVLKEKGDTHQSSKINNKMNKLPMRSSFRIAKKKSIESLSDSFTEKVNSKSKYGNKPEKFTDKLKFMAKLQLKFERKENFVPFPKYDLETSLDRIIKKESFSSSLNKMQIMEDVREGCDANPPSSPGHAEQRHVANQISDKLKTEEVNEHEVEEEVGEEDEDTKDVLVKEEKEEKRSEDELENKHEENSSNSSTSEINHKRKLDEEDSPIKRLKTEIQDSFVTRDKIINEFIEMSECNSMEQINSFSEQILMEIKTLNELAKEKEREWNHLLHMKKIKEELLIRLKRKRQVLLINDSDLSSFQPETNGQQSLLKCNQKMNLLRDIRATNIEKLKQRTILPKPQLDINSSLDLRQKQKPLVDVQSIIADYRQRHPEIVPRRGRRIRHSQNDDKTNILGFSGGNFTIGQKSGSDSNNDLGLFLNNINGSQDNSRSSTIDSTYPDNTSYKDILVQFAKLSQTERTELQMHLKNTTKPPPPYPEVTVHPVTSTSSVAPTNSLLHGILTKTPIRQNNYNTNNNSISNGSKSSFSPTLARLLTAPEKAASTLMTSTPTISGVNTGNMTISEIFCGSKARNEITITPVGHQYETIPTKKESMEEESEEHLDRLVIDETSENLNSRSKEDNSSDNGEDVPQCQGCNQKPAQFVCAGCGNQWYCSRNCQVTAWDEHSEVCSG